LTHVWEPGISGEATKVSDEQGAATLVFPVGSDGPVSKVGIRLKHDSFVQKHVFANIDDQLVSVTLKRGMQIAATGIDPVTQEPITEHLYALTKDFARADWNIKSNGTLVSPVLFRQNSCFRLVQMSDGKAIRFSKLTDILPGDKSRLRFNDLEMMDAVTVTGKLDDEVLRPVKHGMVMTCAISKSQIKKSPNSRNPWWYWHSFSKVNRDGTFTLKEIPADCVLQVFCACEGWANTPPSADEVRAQFPKSRFGNVTCAKPQLFRIGDQPSEITVSMEPLGSVTLKVTDQDDEPVKRTGAFISVPQRFFYSTISGSFNTTTSSARTLRKLRSPERFKNDGWWSKGLLPVLCEIGIVNQRPEDFYTKFAFHNNRTDATGSVVIDGVPAGEVHVGVWNPKRKSGRTTKQVIVESNKNIEVDLVLDLTDPENGGDDD